MKLNEKLKRAVLLLLLETCTVLLERDFEEGSVRKVSTKWRHLLHDHPDLLIEIFPPVFPQELDLKALLNSKPRLYRVSSLFRHSVSKFRPDKSVPWIRISGLWLEDYGFDMGTRFVIYPSTNQLIIQRILFGCPEPLKSVGGRNG